MNNILPKRVHKLPRGNQNLANFNKFFNFSLPNLSTLIFFELKNFLNISTFDEISVGLPVEVIRPSKMLR